MPLTTLPDELQVPAELQEAWNAHPDIVKLGDPVLRQVAQPVTRVNAATQDLIRRMVRAMRAANGLGLAAPQVGVSLRVIMYDTGEGLRVLINPKIVATQGEQTAPPEGCLSIPGLQGIVKRAREIRVKAFDERMRPVMRRATGLEARVIQHEVDHIDGILFIDRAEPDTLHWVIDAEEEASDATRE